MRRILGLISCALSFVYCIFILNSIQMLSVLLYPFHRRWFREVNRWCARSIWGVWVITAEIQNRIQVRITGDVIPPRENALLLCNHQSMADVMVLICFAWRCRRLGDLKWYVKDIVKYVPGPGWGMRFLDCIFVKRDWEKDKAQIETLFSKYKAEDIPIFLVSFLEGTRRTPQKLEEAQTFARERGLYVPQQTLVPRTKGFLATMTGLREHLNAVYVMTIGYPGRTPTLIECFEAAFDRVDLNVRRFPIEQIPTSEDDLTSWARQRFEEMDKELIQFRDSQQLTGTERPSKVHLLDWFRSEEHRSLD